MLTLRLAANQLAQRKARSALTAAAVAMAVSLVVCMTSGFASLRAAAFTILDTFYGSTDVTLAPAQSRGEMLPESLAGTLAADPRVRSVEVRYVTDAPLLSGEDHAVFGRPARLTGVHPAQHLGPAEPLVAGTWFADRPAPLAVIDSSTARRLNVNVGGHIRLPAPAGTITLTVTGILQKPSVLNLEAPSVYVPLPMLQSALGQIGKVNRIVLALKPGTSPDAFAAALRKNPPPGAPPLDIRTAAAQRQKFDRNFQVISMLSYLGGTVSMVAAAFIIFTTLSMGVAERSRVLAMLRAIGAVRRQVAAVVIIEGLLLAGAGAATGVGIGWLAVRALAASYPKIFLGGAVLSTGGTTWGIAGSLLAAALAAAMPALAAGRVDALEAMATVARPASRRLPILCAILGAAMLAIDPLVASLGGISSEVRLIAHLALGLPSLLLGLFLIAPLVVIVVEKLLSPLVARVMALEPAVLKQQLTGGLWRTAGTVGALMVGLAVLIVVQSHGRSMLGSWQLPDHFPDLLIYAPLGLTDPQLAKIETVPGFRPGEVLPVSMVTPQLGTDLFGLGGLMQTPGSTIVFGMDPQRAFGSDDGKTPGMLDLHFIQGNVAAARRMLEHGHAAIVSEEFHRLKKLGVGDTLSLTGPGGKPIHYTIAGVVRSPGVDMIIRLFDIEREFQQWTAASVLTTRADVDRDFGPQLTHLVAANVTAARDKSEIEWDLKERLRTWGLLSADARSLKRKIDHAGLALLDLLSTVAILAMAVASVGVTNTLIAGIRTRRWQLGVLRSIGLSRAALVRLVLAEAAMIGAVAAGLGLLGGVIITFCSNRMALGVLGHEVPATIYWPAVGIGVAITVAVALAASLLPALGVARTDTLTLLKSGRAAA